MFKQNLTLTLILGTPRPPKGHLHGQGFRYDVMNDKINNIYNYQLPGFVWQASLVFFLCGWETQKIRGDYVNNNGDPPSPNSREFGDPFVYLGILCDRVLNNRIGNKQSLI